MQTLTRSTISTYSHSVYILSTSTIEWSVRKSTVPLNRPVCTSVSHGMNKPPSLYIIQMLKVKSAKTCLQDLTN